MTATILEPPVGDVCACGCGKPLPRSKDARRYAGIELDKDPFATSLCARKWYGCELRTKHVEGDPA